MSGQVILKEAGEKKSGVFEPRDKLYVNDVAGCRHPVQYDYLRAASVSWEKRVWRVLDLREKINQHLMFPLYETQNRTSLLDLVKKGIASGALTLFDDDGFKSPLSRETALGRYFKEVVIKIYDPYGNYIKDSIIMDEITPDRIVQYKLKEDWYFDKERGVQEVRILGICPVYFDPDKEIYIDKGWVYFPQARNLFAGYETYNPKNDAANMNFDEFFQKRFFNSYIQKESNVYDRYISEYTAGLDALMESERVKTDISRWEHDLWHF